MMPLYLPLSVVSIDPVCLILIAVGATDLSFCTLYRACSEVAFTKAKTDVEEMDFIFCRYSTILGMLHGNVSTSDFEKVPTIAA